MRALILKELKPEFKALYKLTLDGNIDRSLRQYLRTEVKDIKDKYNTYKIDPLANKMLVFGNRGAWAREKIEELRKEVFAAKKPGIDNLGQWVSVEIECIFEAESDLSDLITYIRSNALTKFVTIKNDGSVHPSHDDGCDYDNGEDCSCGLGDHVAKEIVVTFKYNDWQVLEMICDKLNSLNAYVNKTCGLHVHFDCRGMSARQVTTLGKRVALCVPALKQMLPASRQNNQYCQTVINGHRTGSRYAFVNMQSFGKHNTLEIRGHSGTIDAVKIINWIKIIKTIMTKRNTKPINNIMDLITFYRLPSDLALYAKNRYLKFNKSVAVDNVDDIENDHNTSVEQNELPQVAVAA